MRVGNSLHMNNDGLLSSFVLVGTVRSVDARLSSGEQSILRYRVDSSIPRFSQVLTISMRLA